jgi:hypothetical protein
MSSEPRQPSEEELRAAYEAEIKQLRIEHILLDNVAALANLAMRRTGLAPGTESERDPDQVRLAIESIRALLPVLEQAAPTQIGAIRDAVSQLQIAYVRIGGQAPGEPVGDAAAGAAAAAGAGPPGTPGAAGTPEAPARTPGAPAEAPPAATSGEGAGATAEPPPAKPGEPGPAQRSGRLWVPGQ